MRIGIIGAGPSGLSTARFLNKSHQVEVLESLGVLGGAAGTFIESGFTFDYGPHIMFSKDKDVLNYMCELLGENVETCKRNNKISFNGGLVKYPFENDLGSLPDDVRYECALGYFDNKYRELYKDPSNLKEWLLFNFGEGICEHYLFPYNEKVWNIPVESLSMLWADRIPKPPIADMVKSSMGMSTEGYLHQLFYQYPLRGGYAMISNELAKGLNIKLATQIHKISKSVNGGYVLTDQNGNKYEYDLVVSTAPVHNLLKIIDFNIPEHVVESIRKLIVNPMYVISLGLNGLDDNKYTAIYFPEKDFHVNRISYPGTFSKYNCPEGCHSIQAEITYGHSSEISCWTDEQIFDHVINGLVRRNIIRDPANVVYKRVDRREFAYVVYDNEYQKSVEVVRKWFWDQRLILNGRFGHFEYLNVDAIISLSKSIAERILDTNINYKDYLNG